MCSSTVTVIKKTGAKRDHALCSHLGTRTSSTVRASSSAIRSSLCWCRFGLSFEECGECTSCVDEALTDSQPSLVSELHQSTPCDRALKAVECCASVTTAELAGLFHCGVPVRKPSRRLDVHTERRKVQSHQPDRQVILAFGAFEQAIDGTSPRTHHRCISQLRAIKLSTANTAATRRQASWH